MVPIDLILPPQAQGIWKPGGSGRSLAASNNFIVPGETGRHRMRATTIATLGLIGLMAGTAPVEAALSYVDWRDVHLIVAVMIVAAAALVPLVAPESKAERSGVTMRQQIKGLTVILKSLAFWRVAPLMMMVIGIYTGFAALWAGPWVRDVAGFEGSEAANVLLALAAAMTASGLATGALAALGKRVGLAPMDFAILTAGLFGLVLLSPLRLPVSGSRFAELLKLPRPPDPRL